MAAKVPGERWYPIKAWAMMYNAVVQVVLLYWSEIWLVIDAMIMVL